MLLGASVLVVIFFLSSTSILLRPPDTAWSAWWPASGVAIGVAARCEKRWLWSVVAAIGVVSALASVVGGRELVLAAWIGAAVAAEVWVGATVLRPRPDREPRLNTAGDLYRLLLCALAASVAFGVIGGTAVAVLRGGDSYLPALLASVPAHAAGVLLIAPLLIPRSREPGSASRVESTLVWIALAVVIFLCFGVNVGLPVAFLVSVPLTWGATRLAPRSALWLMVVTAIAVTTLSLVGRGPFSFGGLAPGVSVLMVQLFNLSFGLVALTLIVLTAQRRRLSEALEESAGLFRAAFDHSPLGYAVVTKTPAGPVVDQLNSAGRDLLGLRDGDPVHIMEHLSDDSWVELGAIIGTHGDVRRTQWQGAMTLQDGRSIQALISTLPSDLVHDSLAIQFFDITEQQRAQHAAREDLLRAGEVQQALLPKDLTPLSGYDVAGACVSAKTVGGDFYDWYRVTGGLAFSLGDVMGKGVGAGMIAATARAALRSARHVDDVTVAVARAADTLNIDAASADSFATLVHGRLRADTGEFDYVDAGHGLAIILRADGTIGRMASSDVPLGIDLGGDWTTHSDVLHPGDTLIAFSDGVLDLYDGTLATLDDVADLARESASPAELASRLTELARQVPELEDDCTVLIVRRVSSE
ncbi:integral membrane sensor domain MASE1 [Conyzicola lurida]|uniref:Integral membrane sensor domain MASE1 n=1 Tax=Conyzicola lurida TaxID=1172621 RepID=A0A841AKG7_9MICO|nr:integral membrane sensor domain MASE1 [Conyzicola lurida]